MIAVRLVLVHLLRWRRMCRLRCWRFGGKSRDDAKTLSGRSPTSTLDIACEDWQGARYGATPKAGCGFWRARGGNASAIAAAPSPTIAEPMNSQE